MKVTFIAAAFAASVAAGPALATPAVDGKLMPLNLRPNPAAVGQPVEIVTMVNWADIKPTGTTAYYSNGTVIPGCEAEPYDSGGNPQPCVHAFDPAGTYHITATYSGDNAYPSSSVSADLVVNTGKFTPDFAIDARAMGTGAYVSHFSLYAAVVDGSFNVDTSATGTFTFFDGLVQVRDCTDVPLVNGQATCQTTFSRGTHPVTVHYSGDAKYNPGISNPPYTAGGGGRKIVIDFDNNGRGDLLFVNQADNSVQAWLMDYTTQPVVVSKPVLVGPSTLTPKWKTGDFNGDGTTDLLGETSDGATTMYLVSGGAVTTQQQLRSPGSGWHVAFVADFDNDGNSDILWRSDSGATEMWLMNGTTVSQQATIMPAGSPWRAVLTGDFDGDGRYDLVWVNDADNSVGLWIMNGTTRVDHATLMGPGTGWAPSFLADFDDDGKMDMVWTNADGSVGVWMMQGTQVVAHTPVMGPNTTWKPVMVSDYNDAIYWKGVDGSVGMWLGNGKAFSHMSLVGPGSTWMPTALQAVFSVNGPNQKVELLWTNSGGSVGLWEMISQSIVSRQNLLPDGTPWKLVNEDAAPNSP